jgi:hypothetical protein
VEADGWQSGFVGQPLELVGDVGGVEWLAVFVGEEEFGFAEPGGEAFAVLPARWARKTLMVCSSRSMMRSPASLLGLPWWGFQPSWVIFQETAIVPFLRSTLGVWMPQASPRRRPRRAMTRKRG